MNKVILVWLCLVSVFAVRADTIDVDTSIYLGTLLHDELIIFNIDIYNNSQDTVKVCGYNDTKTPIYFGNNSINIPSHQKGYLSMEFLATKEDDMTCLLTLKFLSNKNKYADKKIHIYSVLKPPILKPRVKENTVVASEFSLNLENMLLCSVVKIRNDIPEDSIHYTINGQRYNAIKINGWRSLCEKKGLVFETSHPNGVDYSRIYNGRISEFIVADIPKDSTLKWPSNTIIQAEKGDSIITTTKVFYKAK